MTIDMAFGVSMDRAVASSFISSSPAKQFGQRSRVARDKPLLRIRTSLLGATIGSCSLLSCVAASKVDLSRGSAGCPCVNTSAEPWATLLESYEVVAEGQKVLRTVDGLLLLRDYGSSNCKTHDANSRACRKALDADRPWQATGVDILAKDGKAQEWCSTAWCFVDPMNCQVRTGSDSILLRQEAKPSHYFRGNAQYSYETCGSINTYDVKGRADMLKKEISALPAIYVGIPPHGEQDFMFRRGLKFLLSVFADMGVTEDKIVYRNVSERSIALKDELFMGSSWTACVHDVALGLVDACAPMFLDLPIRRRLAPMVRMTAMPMFIMGQTESEETIWTLLAQPFRPFTWHLWGLMLVVMLAVGCAIGTVEHEDDLVDEFGNIVRKSELREKAARSSESSFANAFHHVSTVGGWISDLGKAISVATMGFASNGSGMQAKTKAGKLVQAGYSFFILVCLASYTANTTAFLIMDNRGGLFTSIEDAIQKQIKICIADTLFEPMLTSRYPDIRKVWVTKEVWSKRSRKDVFDAFEKEDCQAFIESEFKLQHLHGQGKLCKVESIGRPIHSYGWGYPMRKALLPHVSWGILQSEIKGGFIDIETLHPPPQTTCPKVELEDAEKPLKARHMMGSVLIVAISIFVASSGRIFHRLLKACGAEERIEKGIDRLSMIELGAHSKDNSSDARRSRWSIENAPCQSDLEDKSKTSTLASARQATPENTEIAAKASILDDNDTLEIVRHKCLTAELSEQSKDWLRQCIEDAVQRTAFTTRGDDRGDSRRGITQVDIDEVRDDRQISRSPRLAL